MLNTDNILVALKANLSKLRTDQVNTSLLDDVLLEQYGQPIKLNYCATLSVSGQCIVIKPHDRMMLPKIEKAILAANLGLTPQSDGIIVRVPIPLLTQDRRNELAKQAKAYGEEAKIAVRQARKKAIDEAKQCKIEDEHTHKQASIQVDTDEVISTIDALVKAKADEILKVFYDCSAVIKDWNKKRKR